MSEAFILLCNVSHRAEATWQLFSGTRFAKVRGGLVEERG